MTAAARLGAGATIRILWSILLALLLASAGGAAQAHAVVLGTEPADGTVLAEPPAEVAIRFNEPVALMRVQVLGPNGADVLPPEGGRAGEDGLHLSLPGGLAQGTYTVSYHAVSLDGHPISGSLVFSVGVVSSSAEAAMDGAGLWRWSYVAARVALYLGLFGAAGGVAYGLLVQPGEPARSGTQRVAAGSALLGITAAVAALGLQGGFLLGGPPSILAETATWSASLRSSFGCMALCAMVGLALVWTGSRLRSRAADVLSLFGAVMAVVSFGLSGHVVTAGPRVGTLPPLLLHAAVAAFWVGSLLPLLRGLDRPADEAAPAVQRFSRIAVIAVPLLVLAGLILAWIQVRRPVELVATEYGAILLAKLALVGALLALAALNRLRLTPALARGERGAADRLGWSVRAELGMVVLILAATAALGTMPPPRALLAQAAPSGAHDAGPSERRLSLMAEDFMAEVTLAPGGIGPNAVRIAITDHQGQALVVPEVTLRASNPTKGIAALERPAERTGPGRWQVADLPLAVTGTWALELDVLISDFAKQSASVELRLP